MNLLDVEAVVLGGGLGIRFGEPMAERLREAMLPHLFVDQRPPAVRVAELGDLGGALGASLMVAQEPSPAPAGYRGGAAPTGPRRAARVPRRPPR